MVGREGSGEVCTPMSRWKSSVGSSSSPASSPLFPIPFSFPPSGITLTRSSSFVIRVERLEAAVEARESREEVREVSMGVMR